MPVTITAKVNPRIRDLQSMFRFNVNELKTIRDRIDVKFRKNERRLFSSEGSSGGRRWPALSPAYAASKRKSHPGRKIMVRTGKLRKGLTGKNHRDHIARFTGAQTTNPGIEVGTRNPVAAYHTSGGSIRSAGLSKGSTVFGRVGVNPLKNKALPDRDTLQQSRSQAAELVGVWRDYLVKVKLPRLFRFLRAAAQTQLRRRA